MLPDPDLLVLDEPTNGLDPVGIVEIRSLLMKLDACTYLPAAPLHDRGQMVDSFGDHETAGIPYRGISVDSDDIT